LVFRQGDQSGEFSLIGRLFTLGSLGAITKLAKNVCDAFFRGSSYVLIWTENSWAIFWATSQTHLVILLFGSASKIGSP
jgi:hypothetical protein